MDLLKSLAPAVLMIIGGVITWFIKSKTEELRAIEEKLDQKRRDVYAQILEPFIRMFADIRKKDQSQAIKQITSYDYRKTAFELNLFGSDEVIRGYNNLMQHVYEGQNEQDQDPFKLMRLWGKLLLEIRRSLGNKKTGLDEIEMLSGMITDIDRIAGK